MELSLSRPDRTQKFTLATDYQRYCARKQVKQRALGISCYFGYAPFLWLRGIEHQQNTHLYKHYRYSLTVSLLFFLILVATAITDALGYFYATRILNPAPDQFDSLAIFVAIFDWIGNIIFLTWILTWFIGLVSALRGRTPHLPFFSSLTQNPFWLKLSLTWSFAFRAGLILLVFIAVHGSLLTAHPNPTPQAYILYTTGGYIPTEQLWASYTPPRWTFSLFFYPIVAAATNHFGKGSVVIAPLNETSFKEAIHNGKFLFVASHGGRDAGSFSYAFDPYGGMLPSNLQPGDAGSQLRYVYFAACYAGYLESEWRQALAPAEVQTYARISYVEEHFIWVWLKGAKVIQDMQ